MNNKHHKCGSLVIMVLLLMTALVAIIYAVHSTSSYFVLLAREREINEQQHQVKE